MLTPWPIVTFVRESNLIEGIERDPTTQEVEATRAFLQSPFCSTPSLAVLQAVYAPSKPLRTASGMNVRVGNYVAPPGGIEIAIELEAICGRANNKDGNPWQQHIEFERLHPFMDGNGRTGRALWAWQMQYLGCDPFALSFLHRFYYQTLENDPARVVNDSITPKQKE